MLILYSEHGKKFCPTFCIAKAKVNDPEGAFFLRHLGTDRLDLLQTGIRLTGTTEVETFLLIILNGTRDLGGCVSLL